MSDACTKLHDFVAGELGDTEADDFREHLGECDSCPEELGELLQLAALEEDAAAEDAGVEEDDDSEQEEVPVDELAARRRRRAIMIGGIGIAAAAAVALLVLRSPGKKADEIVLASGQNRPLEYRVSAADDYRPYDVMRSGDALPKESISLETLAKLEKRGAKQKLANAHLLMRDVEAAEAILADLEQTASVLADRGVAAALAGDHQSALDFFERSLAKSPNDSRVLFNIGISLTKLDLILGAAKRFEAVGELGGPWAPEARTRAEQLRQRDAETRQRFLKVSPKAISDIANDELISLEDVTNYPGIGRLLFYDALRAARTVQRVDELKPHADALDAAYGGSALNDALAKARESNWKRRGPLGAKYAQLRARKLKDAASFLRELRAAGESDILFGALLLAAIPSPMSAEHLAEYEALAAKSSDDWMKLLAAERKADSAGNSREFFRAVSILEPALTQCERLNIPYRCAALAGQLLRWQAHRFELSAALGAADKAMKWATLAKDQYFISDVRARLSDLMATQVFEIDLRGIALARAYIEEELATGATPPCQAAYLTRNLTQLSFGSKHFKRALEEDRAAERLRAECGAAWPLEPAVAVQRALLLGAAGTLTDVEALLEDIAAVRNPSEVSESLGFDLAEGIGLTAHKDPRGTTALQRVVDGVDGLANPTTDDQINRAYAYWHLAKGAAVAGDFSSALAFLAAEARVPVPKTCAIAVAASQQKILVLVDATGSVKGSHEPWVRETPAVPDSMARRLKDCDEVDVIARAPFFGQPEILPKEVAWRFIVAASDFGEPVEGSRLVVTEVAVPKELGLDVLSGGDIKGATVLKGDAATPERVLNAMTTASLIEVHAHGIMSNDDSFIALAPSQSGEYRLRPEKISQTQLRAAPVVILGACHAGRSAAYFHEPWGLPISFLKSGATTVFASPNPIPDSSSREFFKAVRRNLSSGKSPAASVRDERLRRTTGTSERWASEVLVFERVEEKK